jgi:radical SAM superfamily enzyme YgiQ (UPF0313 family)
MTVRAPRILLIRTSGDARNRSLVRETNVSGVYPPLGVAYLAAAARDAGWGASILDARAERMGPAAIARAVRDSGAQVAGITASTLDWPAVAQAARAIRAEASGTCVLVGGPHVALYAEECLEEAAIDGVVVGEGERSLVEILERVARGDDPAGVAGTIWRRDGQRIRGETRRPAEDLDALPMPALDLLPLRNYHALTVARPFASLIASRGCPFRCRFCAQVYAGGRHREHGAARVVAEMARAVRVFGARELLFFDETFTTRRDKVLDLCDRVRREGLRVRWNIRTRADRLDDAMLAALAGAGCSGIHVGVEAGTDRIQRLMGKDLDLGRIGPTLAHARGLGMETRGYFMLGFPGETEAEIERTVALAATLPLDWASFTVAVAQPGTEIYRDALRRGRYPSDVWRDFALGKIAAPPACLASEEIGADRLAALLRSAYRRFYLRPRRIVAKLADRRLWRAVPATLRTLWAIRRPVRRGTS